MSAYQDRNHAPPFQAALSHAETAVPAFSTSGTDAVSASAPHGAEAVRRAIDARNGAQRTMTTSTFRIAIAALWLAAAALASLSGAGADPSTRLLFLAAATGGAGAVLIGLLAFFRSRAARASIIAAGTSYGAQLRETAFHHRDELDLSARALDAARDGEARIEAAR
ncbi:MAG: hypothetical protein AAGJ87_08920 [Pseudomonadota bacterium]